MNAWPDRLHRELRSAGRAAQALARAGRLLRRVRPDGPYTVADAVEAQARRAPGALALVQGEARLHYGELDAAANRVARWARATGLRRGQTVALMMENGPEYVVAWLGLAKLGVVTALINTHLGGRALAHALRVSGARRLLLGSELAPQLASALPQLDRPPELWAWGGPVEGASDLGADLGRRAAGPLPARVREGLRASHELFYIYTSGTTGLPKAARFSHLRFLASASFGVSVTGAGPADRIYVPLPLYHSAGGVMALGAALLSGAAAVVPPRFTARGFFRDCIRYDVTIFQYIGELCRYLLQTPEQPEDRQHRVRVALGNGLGPEIWERFQRRFAIARIVEFYGATEGNVVLANLDGRVGAVGRIPPWLRRGAGVHLLRFDPERGDVWRDPRGRCVECGPDEPGEAVGRISALSRFEGYSDPAASERKVLRDVFRPGDAYFRTGDLLRCDADGYYYFVDRVGDTFRWKGENVSTREVASALCLAPGVEEATVYGVRVPGAEGRAGMAALVVTPDFDPDRLLRHLEAELPAYARPLFLRLPAALELTTTFKQRKLALQREGYDPAVVGDPLLFLDARRGAYVALDHALHARLLAGALRP